VKEFLAGKEHDWDDLIVTPGWLFPLKGGPLEGMEVRLPYAPATDVDEVYEALPELIIRPVWFSDPSKNVRFKYERQPVLKKDGTPATVRVAGKQFPKVQYEFAGVFE
jgi:hypothetical protein